MTASRSMPGRLRTILALLRVALLYLALWGIGTAVLLQIRADREAGAGAPSSPDATQLSLPFTGINIALEQYETDTAQQERLGWLASHGFGWVRQRFGWDQIEPQAGEYQWQEADRILHSIQEAGLEAVVVLDGSPGWARANADNAGEGNPLAPPADLAEFANFAGAFAARYADTVRYYQIWDEPNIAPHWGARWIDPVAYTQMLRLAGQAIREHDPDAVIIAGALAPTADRGHTAIDEVYYLQRMYAAGARSAFDAIAIQPLGFGYTPDDATQQLDTLNFQRAALIRRAMVNAGDGETPMIIARFGWNRQPLSPWGAVSDDGQRTFASRALDLGYMSWPWLAGMAWYVDQPVAPPDDPVWGFSLSDDLAAQIRQWVSVRPLERPDTGEAAPAGSQRDVVRWGLLLLSSLLCGWRLSAAWRMLPWVRWRSAYRAQPAIAKAAIWALLLAAYMVVTWPPLIVACWTVAALLILAEPSHGLWLAAAVMPFYFQHKELEWGDVKLVVAPITAAALCILPALLIRARRSRLKAGRWDGLALLWAGVIAMSALGVWHWPAYVAGVVELVCVPLILFWAVRAFTHGGADRRAVVTALVVGGSAVAALGLWDWLRGGGTEADALRRLVGPYYSPNHAALYLIRVLFAALGLAVFFGGWRRVVVALLALSVALALALTASRGAMLVGVPAGLVVFGLLAVAHLRRQGAGRRTRVTSYRISAVLAVTLSLVMVLIVAGFSWPRLANSATVAQRLQLWRSASALVHDYWLTGVGPNGFFWRFAAYIPSGSAQDPNILHPHNVWLEFASTGGVGGLLWLFAAAALLIAGVYATLSRDRGALNWPAFGLLAGLVAAFAHAQVDAFAALPDLSAWNWMAMGLIAAALSAHKA